MCFAADGIAIKIKWDEIKTCQKIINKICQIAPRSILKNETIMTATNFQIFTPAIQVLFCHCTHFVKIKKYWHPDDADIC